MYDRLSLGFALFLPDRDRHSLTMANPASGSGDHPREETAAAAAAPVATTTVVDDKPVAENAVPAPASAESTQKPQVAHPQAGPEDDEDSDFDELDGKLYHSNPTIAYHTPKRSLLFLKITNTESLCLQTS